MGSAPPSMIYDSTWRSLTKVGGASLILSGIFVLVDAAFQLAINNALGSYTGTKFEDFLRFVQFNSGSYYGWFDAYTLAVVLGVPGLLALFFFLARTDKGIALVGSTMG